MLGVMTEDDAESLADYWKNYLERYTEETVESEGLPGWAWALIGVAIAVVVLGGGLAAVLIILRKRKKASEEKPELMEVDTTDDENVDVYAVNDSAPAVPAAAEDTAEVVSEPADPADTAEAVSESVDAAESDGADDIAEAAPETDAPSEADDASVKDASDTPEQE